MYLKLNDFSGYKGTDVPFCFDFWGCLYDVLHTHREGKVSKKQTKENLYLILIKTIGYIHMGFPSGSDDKESAYSVGDLDLIPELGRSPGGGHGNPLQYSCLENPHGQRSLAGYSPWGHKESDTTEWLSTYIHIKYSNNLEEYKEKSFLKTSKNILLLYTAVQIWGIVFPDASQSMYIHTHILKL